MKTILVAALAAVTVTAATLIPSTSANACTPAQTAANNIAIRSAHLAIDISKTVGGPKADAAVNALMDLLASIDKALPRTCGEG